jgi:hypothetical protein
MVERKSVTQAALASAPPTASAHSTARRENIFRDQPIVVRGKSDDEAAPLHAAAGWLRTSVPNVSRSQHLYMDLEIVLAYHRAHEHGDSPESPRGLRVLG